MAPISSPAQSLQDKIKDLSFSNGYTKETTQPHTAQPKAHADSYLPHPQPLSCFWQSQQHELHNHRSTEQLPPCSDIVIIGAGYAGTSTAWHLAHDNSISSKSITVLEARGACSGATGRNGGHLRPDMYGHIPTFMERAGTEAAEEVALFEVAHLQTIKKLIKKEKIECDFTLTRSIDVWCNEESAKAARQIYDNMTEKDLDYLDDVIFYDEKDAEGVSISPINAHNYTDIITDFRRQRCQSMCFIHSWHNVAIQVHYASHRSNGQG